MQSRRISFSFFLSLWNKAQGQGTPAVHFRIAHWLEESWKNGDRRLLLMAFRSCGKSTIVGLFAAWLLYRQPDTRILVLAADTLLARKMVRNVKRIIERHPLTAHLKPEKLDQWGSDRFTVNRKLELRDPSMLARGMAANITGSRADVIICDDVEVPRTCDTAAKRGELRERLSEIDFVLSPGGTQLYAGTPHTWFTIYAEEEREEIGETEEFLNGFRRLKIPVLESGKSAWPERFPAEDIESIRRRSGPNRFQSQMMLEPVNIAEGRLDPGLLVRYGGELVMSDELKGLYLIHDFLLPQSPAPAQAGGGGRGREYTKMISASAWWDPSFGGGGDSSVVAAVFTDVDGVRYLHRLNYLNAGRKEGEDEAERQCRLVAQFARELFLPFIAIETNGLGKFLPAILRRELAKARVPCAVREMNSTRAKDIRILEAFDVVLAARLLHVHEGVYKTPFITEMQEWRPGKSSRDDGLDAVAGALSQEPLRLKKFYRAPGGQNWMVHAGAHTADTDFKV